jgi:hypothetical protein
MCVRADGERGKLGRGKALSAVCLDHYRTVLEGVSSPLPECVTT